MRTLIAFSIILSLVAGIWLMQGQSFFWPDRHDPARGVQLEASASRLLGAGLLLIAVCGVMVVQQAGSGRQRAAPEHWQRRFFVLIMLALGLIAAAIYQGEPGPNPDARPRSTLAR